MLVDVGVDDSAVASKALVRALELAWRRKHGTTSRFSRRWVEFDDIQPRHGFIEVNEHRPIGFDHSHQATHYLLAVFGAARRIEGEVGQLRGGWPVSNSHGSSLCAT